MGHNQLLLKEKERQPIWRGWKRPIVPYYPRWHSNTAWQGIRPHPKEGPSSTLPPDLSVIVFYDRLIGRGDNVWMVRAINGCLGVNLHGRYSEYVEGSATPSKRLAQKSIGKAQRRPEPPLGWNGATL